MSQTYIDNCYILTNLIANSNSDLQDIENNFTTLKSSFSGASAPVTGGDYSTVAGLTWYYTTKLQLRYRNAANNGWMYFFPGDSTSKIWVYRNDAVEGMVVDSTVTDKVLAIKGGSQAYNVSGGNIAGTWTASHTHGAGSFVVNTYHRHSAHTLLCPVGYRLFALDRRTNYQGSTTTAVTGTSATGGSTSAWRPTAAVGVLLKPDL